MSASTIPAFLQGQRVKTFAAAVKPHHVFGFGVSWNKKTGKIEGVRLILRDIYDASSFKKFAKNTEEKAVEDFFQALPLGKEDPDQGLHGHLYSLKISARGEFKQAFYRRLGGVPVCYEEGEWSKYLYEDLHEYAFNSLKVPEEAGKLFRLEVKYDFEGIPKSFMLYPRYAKMKEYGAGMLREGFLDFYTENLRGMLVDFPDIFDDIEEISTQTGMAPVSLGETEASIKAYFVDFDQKRVLLPH